MKKNIKKGFTLAELLISIAIISIISTMGIVISKKGMDKAYDYYVYNSYKSISSAIGDAISNNYKIDDDDKWDEFLVHIASLFGKSLYDYIKIHRDNLIKKNKTEYVFLNNHGQGMTRQGFFKILKQLLKEKGLNEDISPHTLRHTFATRCIESGMPAEVVQKKLGHHDVEITINTYTDIFNKYESEHTNNYLNYLRENKVLLQ